MKIEYDEKQNIEFKEIWRDEYLKWICGFANAQGGTLYIGVNDNAEVVGVENAKKMLEDIPNKVRDALGIMVDVNLIQVEEKNFLQNHGSRPYNPDIANAFFRAGEIESWGRGIEKICTALSQQNLNPPEYIQLGEAVCTTFRFVEPTTSETDIPAGSVEARKSLPITAQKTMLAIIENPRATIAELSKSTNQSERTIKTHQKLLQESKLIRRIGSKKSGVWEILVK